MKWLSGLAVWIRGIVAVLLAVREGSSTGLRHRWDRSH